MEPLSPSLKTITKAIFLISYAFLFLFCASNQVSAEIDHDRQFEELTDELLIELGLEDDPTFILTIISDNIDVISKDHDMSIKALIIAREYGAYFLSQRIADAAIAAGFITPRLVFETALVFMKNGECINANLLFEALIIGENENAGFEFGTTDDWIVEESIRALHVCEEPQIWFYDYTVYLNHNNNLAASTPRQSFIPDENSELGKSIKILQKIFPSIPDEIVVGNELRKGVVATYYQTLSKFNVKGRHQYGLHFINDINLTTPKGYEHYGIAVALSRKTTRKHFLTLNYVEVKGRRYFGRGHGSHYNQLGIALENSITFRQKLWPTIFFAFEHLKNDTAANLTQNSAISSFKLTRFAETKDDVGLVFEAGTRINRFSEQALNNKMKFISVGFNALTIKHSGGLAISLDMVETKPDRPAVWLAERHTTRQNRLNFTYRFLFKNRPIDVMLGLVDSYSQNRIDNYNLYSLSFRFK